MRAGLDGPVVEERDVVFRIRYETEEELEACRLHLCQDRPLDALEEALKFMGDEVTSITPARYGRMLFYRGLAYLALGEEVRAHEDLAEQGRLAESSGDVRSSVLGHFFHALAFERHGEPWMAAAELEVAKDIILNVNGPLRGRLNAFLAHLWLRRGQLEMARDLVQEALRDMEGEARGRSCTDIGMALLASAEVLASGSRFEEAEEAYQQATRLFAAAGYGRYMEALAHAWYGETLMRAAGRGERGREVLSSARDRYAELGNAPGVARIEAILISS